MLTGNKSVGHGHAVLGIRLRRPYRIIIIIIIIIVIIVIIVSPCCLSNAADRQGRSRMECSTWMNHAPWVNIAGKKAATSVYVLREMKAGNRSTNSLKNVRGCHARICYKQHHHQMHFKTNIIIGFNISSSSSSSSASPPPSSSSSSSSSSSPPPPEHRLHASSSNLEHHGEQ